MNRGLEYHVSLWESTRHAHKSGTLLPQREGDAATCAGEKLAEPASAESGPRTFFQAFRVRRKFAATKTVNKRRKLAATKEATMKKRHRQML